MVEIVVHVVVRVIPLMTMMKLGKMVVTGDEGVIVWDETISLDEDTTNEIENLRNKKLPNKTPL